MFKLGNESGRSMVEMLGVLAIIGVLSIGGIAGYSIAIKSLRSNEIVNACSLLNMFATTQNEAAGTTVDISYSDFFGSDPAGATELKYVAADKKITVTITDEGICQRVTNLLGNKATGTCSGNASELTVTMDAEANSGNQAGGNEQQDSTTCPNGTTCTGGQICCPHTDSAQKHVSGYTCTNSSDCYTLTQEACNAHENTTCVQTCDHLAWVPSYSGSCEGSDKY